MNISFQNQTLRKLTSAILIFVIVFPAAFAIPEPKKAEAVVGGGVVTAPALEAISKINQQLLAKQTATSTLTWSQKLKDVAKEIAKQVAQAVARRALAEMTKSTINWINTGDFGNPLFVENPESFFNDIAKYEIKKLIDATGYDSLRFPFGKDFALQTIDSYKRTLENNLEYSLSGVMQDPAALNSYRNDFNVGGWNGFLINTQYPQNNYLGYQMLATEKLAKELAGKAQNNIQKVQAALDQGQGFLSTQTCGTKPGYNSIANQFKQPTWKPAEYERNNPPPEWVEGNWETEEQFTEALNAWETAKQDAEYTWAQKNTCPPRKDGSSGFVTTTPGSVVADAARKAVGAPQENAYVAMVTGNLSAIFDALLQKFLDDGLSKLATTINPPPKTEKEWDYFGNTLGTVSAYGSTDWSTWPDEVLSVSEMKTKIAEGMSNTSLELLLISNDDPENPGILQTFNATWPKARELDMCLPGPNVGWEDRLDEEMRRNSIRVQEGIGDKDAKKAADAQIVLKELQLAVSYFKDWTKNKMLMELPGSILYMDAVAGMEDIYRDVVGLNDEKKRVKTQALARLKAIQTSLNTFTTNPEPGTPEEKILVELKKQFDATRNDVGNEFTIDDLKNQLAVAKERLAEMTGLVKRCVAEKGALSAVTPPPTTSGGLLAVLQRTINAEQAKFCNDPVKGGNSHYMFINAGTITHPELLLVNAKNVYTESKNWGQISGSVAGYAATGAILGTVVPGVGNLVGAVVGAGVGVIAGLFSSGAFKGTKVDIQLSCNIIYNTTEMDYKRNIPGLTGSVDPSQFLLPPVEFPPENGQCVDTGNKYAGVLGDAMDQVLAENPDIAAKDPRVNTAGSGQREYRANAIEFLRLTSFKLESMGYKATEQVLNGNNLPSTGDIVAVWREGDTVMERYDAIDGGASVMQDAPMTTFEGFVPLDCTLDGGSNDCGCQTADDPLIQPGGQCNFDTCAEHGHTNLYESDVKSAVRQALAELETTNPGIGNLPSYDAGSGGSAEGERAVMQLRDRTISILQSRGFNAGKVSSPGQYGGEYFYYQVVEVWKNNDPDKHGYRITAGGAKIREAIEAGICGAHRKLDNTDLPPTPGSTMGMCLAANGGGTNPPTNPTVPPPTDGTPYISSVSPMTATAGTTVITISGTNFSTLNKPANVATVRFYFGLNGRTSVDGTVNTAKTRITVTVPAEVNTSNTTIKIYRDGSTESNPYQIQLGNASSVIPAPSFNASGGWGGNLAYNPTNNTWLVVSSGTPQNGTYGRVMNNDGTTVGPEIVITTGHSGGPKVAYSKDINKYLVVWLSWDDANKTTVSQIKGRFINPDGTFSGAEFQVHADTNYPNDASMTYSNSTMQYDSKNKKFVYVWQTIKPGLNSNLRTISTTGVVGNRINLTSDLSAPYAEDGRGDPAVAIKESTNEYCVVYGRGYSLNNVWNASLHTRTVNALTGALGPETKIISSSGPNAIFNARGIVYNAVNNKYLVGWTGADGAKAKFMTSCNGSTAGATITLNSRSSGHSLAYNSKSNQYASIGQNSDSGNSYVILNSNGVKVKEGIAFTGGHGNYSPAIAANTTDGTFSAISSYEYATTRFAPNLGNPVAGAITQPVSTPKYLDLGAGSFPDVVWFQARLYVAYRSANNLAINLYSFDKDLGDQKTEKIFTLSAGAGGFPRMTVHNNTLWLAYRDGEASNQDIKLWNKETGTTESLGPAVGDDPVAVGNGYIAWQKCEGTNCASSKVYRRQLTGGTQVFMQNYLPTGISRILPTGAVVMIDTDRTAMTWGLNSWYAGKLTVTRDVTPQDDNGVAARMNGLESSEFNLWSGQRAHTPHAATDFSGNYAVTTWNPTVRIATFTGPI